MNKEEVYQRIEKDKKIFDNALYFADVATLVNMCDCYTDRFLLYQENKQLKKELDCTIGIVEHKRIINEKNKEIHQLKDNWNKLKEIAKSQSGFKKRADLKGGLWFEVDDLLDKMRELEQGSCNNE